MFTSELLSVLLWLAFGKFLIVGILMLIKNLPSIQKLRVYDIEVPQEQTVRELKAAWVVLTDAMVLAILVWLGLIKLSPESFGNILLTFLVFFIWVEVWFYWTHRWMHQNDFMWKIHEHHHLSLINQPLTAISFSFIEKFVFYTCGWFLLPTLLSWYIPISAYGIAAYFTCYYIASPIAHSNMEFLYSLLKYLPFGMSNLSSSATSHGIHHARCDVNFGLITSVLDCIFGTYAQDTEKVKKRLYLGQNLTSLQEILE
ncbi:sterol desaturase family protein [Pelatocladus sp. BLCC-F211]|uniref:sterol desaturase family protein n=1 Tax=Pelatocladus sp. BLCC-F211 TaxID=3342752 RepID=UPI0035B94E23